jgi:hypothetical protein
MDLQAIHRDSLKTSTLLSQYSARMLDVDGFIKPLSIFRVLNEAKIRFMLIGAHAFGGWMGEPRARSDVEILTAAKSHVGALRTLMASFPHLKAGEQESATRLSSGERDVFGVTVWRPAKSLYREAYNHPWAVLCGVRSYVIPSLEMALAMTFERMKNLPRGDADVYQNAHDFILMVKTNPAIDLKTLARLGKLACQGGGREIVDKVRAIEAGQKFQL